MSGQEAVVRCRCLEEEVETNIVPLDCDPGAFADAMLAGLSLALSAMLQGEVVRRDEGGVVVVEGRSPRGYFRLEARPEGDDFEVVTVEMRLRAD